jgi:hypothetical protein
MGRYKLLREQQSTNQDWQLFDLQADIGETANLLAARADLAEHLRAEYERWEKDATSNHRALRRRDRSIPAQRYFLGENT